MALMLARDVRWLRFDYGDGFMCRELVLRRRLMPEGLSEVFNDGDPQSIG